MLGKQAWRISQNESALCSQVLKGIYFPSTSFWNARKGSRPSWGWQSLMFGRDNIAESVRWTVGTGKDINIREDR